MANKNDNPTVTNVVNPALQPDADPDTNPVEPVEQPADQPDNEEPGRVTIVVVKRFRDRYDQKTWYEPGTDLTFEAERANDCVRRGYVKIKKA